MRAAEFFERGWCVFDPEPSIEAWARWIAVTVPRFTSAREGDWRCGGTWFPGVNIVPNEADGSWPAADVPPLSGSVLSFVDDALGLGGIGFDRAQLSICYPGYPKPSAEESAAAFRFRRDRDAAHVDGLLRAPPARRRWLGETHGFILGIPLSAPVLGASPLVVWEGSHEIMRAGFREVFDGHAPEEWQSLDVTEAYAALRRRCFEECARVAVTAPPGTALGGCYLVHRLALHGVAPWTAPAGAEPRAVAYLRPDPFPGRDPSWWLDHP